MTVDPLDLGALEEFISCSDPTAPLDHVAIYASFRAAAPALLAAARERDKLREALSWFVTDERFSVAVAGNPNVVERMLADARAALEGKAK